MNKTGWLAIKMGAMKSGDEITVKKEHDRVYSHEVAKRIGISIQTWRERTGKKLIVIRRVK